MPSGHHSPADLRVRERQDDVARRVQARDVVRLPAPGPLLEVRLRRPVAADEDGQRRLVVDAVGLVPQPAVPPAGHQRHVVDVRAGHRGRRAGVAPRAGQHPHRRPGGVERPRRPVRDAAVAVGPAGDEHRRAGDAVVARGAPPEGAGADRAVPPVRAVRALREPLEQPGRRPLDPPPPLLAPAVAEQVRHRREAVHRDHVERVVDEVEQPQRAALVVDVVGPAVVGGVAGDHRAQRRRPLAGELEGVEAAPARAEHADRAGAPLPVGQPGDRPRGGRPARWGRTRRA